MPLLQEWPNACHRDPAQDTLAGYLAGADDRKTQESTVELKMPAKTGLGELCPGNTKKTVAGLRNHEKDEKCVQENI